tara:strand:+ start:12818 stop:13990 length:1173 start_codon:yes stop_codon:yes gene_type:complete
MKKFLAKTWPYLLIGLLYVGLGEYLLTRLKETVPIEEIAQEQTTSKKELYYGRQVLGDCIPLYKYTNLQLRKPKVLVVGQSVTLQFRDFVFQPFAHEFYNAGLMIRNLADLHYLADLIEKGEIDKPQFMLIAVDLSFVLNKTFLDNYSLEYDMPDDRALSMKSHLQGMQKLMLNGSLRAVPDGNYGFGKAGLKGSGYRNDGSYRHKPEIEQFVKDGKYYDGNLRQRLKERKAPFIVPFDYDPSKAERVVETLNRFKNEGIELLLYIPPYSDVFFNEALKDTMFVDFWQDYMDFQQRLKSENFELIEFTTPARMGLDDRFFVDAEHPGEVLCALQIKRYLEENQTKSKVLRALNFKTLDSLLVDEYLLPISFLKDSINTPFKGSENIQKSN